MLLKKILGGRLLKAKVSVDNFRWKFLDRKILGAKHYKINSLKAQISKKKKNFGPEIFTKIAKNQDAWKNCKKNQEARNPSKKIRKPKNVLEKSESSNKCKKKKKKESGSLKNAKN